MLDIQGFVARYGFPKITLAGPLAAGARVVERDAERYLFAVFPVVLGLTIGPGGTSSVEVSSAGFTLNEPLVIDFSKYGSLACDQWNTGSGIGTGAWIVIECFARETLPRGLEVELGTRTHPDAVDPRDVGRYLSHRFGAKPAPASAIPVTFDGRAVFRRLWRGRGA